MTNRHGLGDRVGPGQFGAQVGRKACFRLHPIKPTSLRLLKLFEQFRLHFVEFLAAFLLPGDELE
jgi:hypothetical protein